MKAEGGLYLNVLSKTAESTYLSRVAKYLDSSNGQFTVHLFTSMSAHYLSITCPINNTNGKVNAARPVILEVEDE
jgi:hypothetical protein